jgi:fatty acid desaturase
MTAIPASPAAKIPLKLNLAILTAAICAAVATLWLASHADGAWTMIAAAVAFAFASNTIFSLLHEAVHGIFHPNPTVNAWAGRLAACFFPTSFSVQRGFHLTHHRYNRTPHEQFDLIRPGDNRLLKIVQWYCIMTGLYGLSPPVFCLLYALSPAVFRMRWWARRDSGIGHQTSAAIYFAAIQDVPLRTIRLETLAAVILQLSLFYGLQLAWPAWLLCHACFAISWSALQYADHAFSPLDPKEGAWNLRVTVPVRWLFLNYHYHLAHHQAPQVPWIHLPARVAPGSPQPSFWSIYLRMWRGPRSIAAADASYAPTNAPAASGLPVR